MAEPDRFAHTMPFGAEVRPDGHVRFRLWAPAREHVSLVLEESYRVIPMARLPGGWFELVTDAAPPGSRYRFRLDDDDARVPDPASRQQDDDVHGASVIVDPRAYRWKNPDWRGRPWEEAVLYELHVGAFSEEGTFDGLRRRLDHLVDLGITAVELMPLAEFPGTRNWGYDGVQLFAPDAAYGTPNDLKALIDEIHARGLMAFLDVVYNHFGPEGNYLHLYASQFFDPEKHTPWGAAIDYGRRDVRDFAINNVLYWLEEYRFDGLRFDAVDQIIDHSEVHILTEIAETVRRRIPEDRHVHLVLENDRNEAHRLERREDGRPRFYNAQWNDDIHHVYQYLLTGYGGGYYADYAQAPHQRLARALASGFVYQGEVSEYRHGERRGEASGHLPPTAFVGFIQNHDQVGNRAFGERIADLAPADAVKAMTAVLLLAPQVPLLFMGEEWGATQPFCFFTDFHDELADAVREGRRREFQKFPEFASEEARAHIPDPNATSTFEASRLDWSALEQDEHAEWLRLCRKLLALRAEHVVPRLAGAPGGAGEGSMLDHTGVQVSWRLGDGSLLSLLANLGDDDLAVPAPSTGKTLFEMPEEVSGRLVGGGTLPAWSVVWTLEPAT